MEGVLRFVGCLRITKVVRPERSTKLGLRSLSGFSTPDLRRVFRILTVRHDQVGNETVGVQTLKVAIAVRVRQ
jgi:hypothetical protein